MIVRVTRGRKVVIAIIPTPRPKAAAARARYGRRSPTIRRSVPKARPSGGGVRR
jgi:hypothetical protein